MAFGRLEIAFREKHNLTATGTIEERHKTAIPLNTHAVSYTRKKMKALSRNFSKTFSTACKTSVNTSNSGSEKPSLASVLQSASPKDNQNTQSLKKRKCTDTEAFQNVIKKMKYVVELMIILPFSSKTLHQATHMHHKKL